MNRQVVGYRILVIDDNPSIHEDFRKILAPPPLPNEGLADLEAVLFGKAKEEESRSHYQVDFAFQGEEGVLKIERALQEGQPYALAFVDVRMPPGLDGVQTLEKIWQHDVHVQTVMCTAYSDYSWEEVRRKLGHSDRLLILKKPFDTIEVLQLADMLTCKWQLGRQRERQLMDLERMIGERTRELRASQDRLEAEQRRLSGLNESTAAAVNTQQRRRVVLGGRLSQAIEDGALNVHYQPLIEISSRRIVGLEALARWRDPLIGAISPAEFIPIAEETGLILPLGEYVLRSACQQIMDWQKAGIPTVPVSVNVSAAQLQRQDLVQVTAQVLRETGLRPQYLMLELTESSLIENAQSHIAALQALRKLGIGIEIDDFGTGYSCLSYLKHLPIDVLKIDRSFVDQLGSNTRDESIVSAILSMSHTLGLKVVAEGVETAAQLDALRRHQCEYAQGYFFSRPLPEAACRELLLQLASRDSFTDTLRLNLQTAVK